ncbi:MAG TPA: hypothetical protein DEB05_12365, partial [Firmicutes bacterium]|nr:hypothetical protein [Bacillota bacterium]
RKLLYPIPFSKKHKYYKIGSYLNLAGRERCLMGTCKDGINNSGENIAVILFLILILLVLGTV